MTVRDLIVRISSSPDIETEFGDLQPQTVKILISNQEYDLKDVWVRGDNVLVLESQPKGEQDGRSSKISKRI